jgi:hypothetical protein
MAFKARIDGLLRLHQRESARDCGFATLCIDVGFGRAMASFAARPRGWLLAGCDAFEMRVLVEVEPDVRMAGFADSASQVARRRSLRERSERYQTKQQS